MSSDVLQLTINKLISAGVHLEDLEILLPELADTICNYYLYLTLGDLVEKDESLELFEVTSNYGISFDSISFLRDNYFKIHAVVKGIENLRALRDQSQEEFRLIQKCLIVYLGRDLDWEKVMKMREHFGIRRNLKKKNRALMISGLFELLRRA